MSSINYPRHIQGLRDPQGPVEPGGEICIFIFLENLGFKWPSGSV